MKIGWIGLGKMGIPMSTQLIKAGYSLTVHNRTRDKEKELTERGADSAASPKTLLEKTDVVFLMVSDDEAVRDVFTGDEGLLRGDAEGKIIINMSTISPDISREMAQKCTKIGAGYLDAPVSGSVPQAENQKLAIIVGGEKAVFEKAKPILKHLGKSVLRVGDTGAGNSAKLAVNTFLGIITGGLAEVIQFANQMDIQTEDLLSIINNSALGSPFIKMKGNAVLEDDYNAAFTLNHLAKDLRLAKESGLEGAVGTTVYKNFRNAQHDFGQEDIMAIIKYLNNT